VKDYEDDIVKYKFEQPDTKKSRDLEWSLETYSADMISLLATIGKVFDLDILRGGVYVLDDHLHPDYLKKIRITFYGSSDDYEHHRPRKRQEAIDAKHAQFPEADPTKPKHADKFWCPGWENGKRSPHLALLVDLHLDHKEGAASHWTREGHNCGQSVREAFFTNGSNIEDLCEACNTAKKSEGDVYGSAVGVDFSGPRGLR
jgi:hypothetical protein